MQQTQGLQLGFAVARFRKPMLYSSPASGSCVLEPFASQELAFQRPIITFDASMPGSARWVEQKILQNRGKPMIELEKPYCSVAKVGTKWIWCTWRNYPYHESTDDPVYGYEMTKAEAEERAKAEALRMGADPADYDGPLGYRRDWYNKRKHRWYYHHWHGLYAREWHSVLAARKRKPNEKAAPKVQKTEYVYHWGYSYYSPYSDCESCAHRILKKTRTRIFIEETCGGHVSEWGGVRRVPGYALDRAKLEAGEVIYRGSRWFRLSPERPVPEDGDDDSDSPECLQALGLKSPATEREVKRAFRRLARKHHPDVGGEAEAFRNLQQQYEAALALVEDRPCPPR